MSHARRRYLIVDGHSVIHAWDDLRAQHAVNPRSAREELIARLTVLHDGSAESLVVVFDGTGPRKAASERVQPVDVQVVYSGRGQTADAVIERLVAFYAGTHDLTVATNDGGERTAVTASGAWWMSADGLRERWQLAVRAQGREISKLRGRGGGFQLGDAWNPPRTKGGAR
jgi:predicted RNA-binding protein with PIN domain